MDKLCSATLLAHLPCWHSVRNALRGHVAYAAHSLQPSGNREIGNTHACSVNTPWGQDGGGHPSQVHATMPPRFTWMSFCLHSKHCTTEVPLALARETCTPCDWRPMGEASDIWVYLTLTQTQTVWACLPIEMGSSTLVPYALESRAARAC